MFNEGDLQEIRQRKGGIASTTGTARTAIQASCRPIANEEFVSCAACMACSASGVVAVGLNTQQKTIGEPSLMPPDIPPDMVFASLPRSPIPAKPVP